MFTRESSIQLRTRKEGKLEFSPEGRWQIRPVRASATSEKLNILVYLTLKRSSVLS